MPFLEPGPEPALYTPGSSCFYIIGSLMNHVIQNLTNGAIPSFKKDELYVMALACFLNASHITIGRRTIRIGKFLENFQVLIHSQDRQSIQVQEIV